MQKTIAYSSVHEWVFEATTYITHVTVEQNSNLLERKNRSLDETIEIR